MNPSRLTALLALPLLAGCAGVPRVEMESHQIDLPIEFSTTPCVLEVRVHHGFVVVRSGDELSANAVIEVSQKYARTARRFASQLRMLPDDGSPHRILAVVPPAELGVDGFHVRYALTVPPEVELVIASEAGDVTLKEFAGRATIETEAGNVRARLRGGRIAIQSGSGTADVAGQFERAHIATRSGPIDIDLPDQLHSLNGIEVETRTGDVRLSASMNNELEVEFATESGLLFSELPIDWVSDCEAAHEAVHYRGVVGSSLAQGERPRIQVRSGSGNFRLERRTLPDPNTPFSVAASH